MKKALVVLAVVVVALAVCAPAFATSGVVAPDHISWWHPAKTFTAAGKVQAVDTTNSRLVVRVTLASVGAAPYLGEDLTVVVKPRTQLLRTHGRLFRAITLSDIKLGDHVRVTGAINLSVPTSPVFTAKRVVATTVLAPSKIKWFAFRGPVKSVDATGGSLVAKPLLRDPRPLGRPGRQDDLRGRRQRPDLHLAGGQARRAHARRHGRRRSRARPGLDRPQRPGDACVHHQVDARLGAQAGFVRR